MWWTGVQQRGINWISWSHLSASWFFVSDFLSLYQAFILSFPSRLFSFSPKLSFGVTHAKVASCIRLSSRFTITWQTMEAGQGGTMLAAFNRPVTFPSCPHFRAVAKWMNSYCYTPQRAFLCPHCHMVNWHPRLVTPPTPQASIVWKRFTKRRIPRTFSTSWTQPESSLAWFVVVRYSASLGLLFFLPSTVTCQSTAI